MSNLSLFTRKHNYINFFYCSTFMDENCIFCKINKGKIDSYTLYEDNLVRAFLDVNPVSKGHILVIPKEHYENR